MKTKFNEVWAVVFAQVLCASTLMGQSPLLSIQGSMATPASQSCGLRSLYEVARIQKPGDPKMRAILNVPVVSEAISLSELASLSKDYQLDLVPVERLSGQALPVPSVAHWGRDHYVAILGRQGGNYRVFDPALDSTLWLPRDKLNARISGQFLASAPTAASEEWRRLSQVDAEQIVGAFVLGPLDDVGEEDCPKDEGNMPKKCPTCDDDDEDCPPGDDAGCSGCGTSTDFSGYAMPVWRVTEPNINLWISDIPLFYTTSHDDQLIFKLNYKQRNSRSDNSVFSVGNGWECNWLTYAEPDPNDTNKSKLFVPGGGQRTYTFDVMDYVSITVLSSDGSSSSVAMKMPKGQTNFYGFLHTNSSGVTHSFVSTKVLADGRTIKFGYLITNSLCLLTSLVDPDGLTNYVRYQNTNSPNYITEVENPYGRKATLKYDSSSNLTSIVDMIGFTNSFQYDSQGLITNMTTPYGPTTFQATTNSSGSQIVNRSMLVTEPNGSHQLYLYRVQASQLNPTNSTALIPDSYPLPDTTPFSNTLETSGLGTRDSFYWGRQQYAALSESFRTNSPANFNLLTMNDYNLSRMKHWLYYGQSAQTTVGHTMSLLRMPSPDGVKDVQRIWYDYAGKISNGNEGTNSRPSLIARVLPDSTSQFIHFDRTNFWRKPTQIVSTYSTVGTNVYLRTNTMSYAANNVDPLEVRGPTNELLFAYGSYNAFHQPGVITNALLSELTTITYNDTNHQIIRIQWPSGGAS